MKNFLLDIQRAILLLWVTLKFSIGPILRHVFRRQAKDVSYAVHIRLALEELGLTYLKLGQFLALRFDIMPAEVNRELNNLFENVPQMAFEEVKAVVESELRGPLQKFFHTFNRDPVAAASVAQVHKAQTHTYEWVAVKIQRPGIARIFASDMRNLHRITALADAFGLLGKLSTTEMADEFEKWTLREMNFVIEGRTADSVRKNAAPYEIIPRVYWELTTPKVLTMEFIDGISMAQVGNFLDEGGVSRVHDYLPNLELHQALHHLTFASLRQLFVTGLFHGDPHLGNILIRDDSTVAFIDFGIFGTLSFSEREILSGLLENLAVGNIDESFHHYSKELTPTDETDPRAFKREAKAILLDWYQSAMNPGSTVEELHLGKFIGEMIAVSRRNRLQMGRRYLLFWRTLNALDSSLLRLRVPFNLMSELRDFFEQTRPDFVQRLLDLVTDRNRVTNVAELACEVPGNLSVILSDLAWGYNKSTLYIYEYESTEAQHTNNMDAKWLAAGVLGISLTILAILAMNSY